MRSAMDWILVAPRAEAVAAPLFALIFYYFPAEAVFLWLAGTYFLFQCGAEKKTLGCLLAVGVWAGAHTLKTQVHSVPLMYIRDGVCLIIYWLNLDFRSPAAANILAVLLLLPLSLQTDEWTTCVRVLSALLLNRYAGEILWLEWVFPLVCAPGTLIVAVIAAGAATVRGQRVKESVL